MSKYLDKTLTNFCYDKKNFKRKQQKERINNREKISIKSYAKKHKILII